MQVSSAASSADQHSRSQLPVSTLSIKAIQYVGTEDDIEDLLSSDLEVSFASSMSLNSSSPGPVKSVDNFSREDVVPMDISPEPPRIVHQPQIAGHFIEKVTRARAFTTSVRLFGRDLSNGTSIPPTASSCELGATIASYVRVVSIQTQPHTISHKVNPIIL
jgi:M-phase inducer tyrosine phosphatase